MKFTLSWLKDHLDTDAALETIGRTLTMIGLEVEEIHDPGADLADFVVGHVRSAEKHPDADKLKVCMVDSGTETVQIVCGAPNARQGLKVALARPGAVIPTTGDTLKTGKIRGVESFGMMCSSRELGLGDDHAGIMELPADAPVGAPLTTVLPIDPVIDIAVTPNRADALGVRGIARDLAAAGLGRLKPDPLVAEVAGAFDSPITVRRAFPEDAGDACPLFIGRTIRGVRNGDSPPWLKDRLAEIGLRPISALVDITNYVTIGWGRPLHVFDADRLTGDIVVRFATPGEEIAALNDKTYTLDDDVVVIADQAKAQSIAGVVGGAETGCTAETVTVFLEAALFDPLRIARTARTYAIESDAKHRFERGVDPASASWGIHLATRLIQDLCGGEASHLVVAGAPPDRHREIAFRPARVARRVGIEVPEAEMKAALERLGCGVTTGTPWTVVPPSWRADLEEEHDLIEEVARLHGYDAIPVVPLPRPSMPTPVLAPRQKMVRQITRGLAARGLRETVSWSFCSTAQAALFGGGQAAMTLANPISSDLDCMRPSVLPNLAAAAGRNAARGYGDVALFEVGPQFHGPEPGQQALMASGLRAGRTGARHWDVKPRDVDVFDAKADAVGALAAAGAPVDNLVVVAEAPAHYHPGRSGSLKLGPKTLAVFGELHPAVLKGLDVKGPMVGFEVSVEAVPLPKAKPTKTRPLLRASAYQPLERDFAFVLDSGVAAGDVLRAARGADKALITGVVVFDLYEGGAMPEGKKSLAISVTLQPTEKTLTDEEIEAVSNKVISAVEKATGGILRG
jgi:phenylalanyl-tRNA synthetase beta chain